MKKYTKLDRRQLLKSLAICGAGGSLGLAPLLKARRGVAQTTPDDRRFLIVIAAAGGGSIIDSALAIRASESANADSINTFPDQEVKSIPGTQIRGVDLSMSGAGQIPIPFTANQSSFVQKHKDDMLVTTVTGTSVNHVVAQKRSLTGNEAWNGRTLQEAVAFQYGAGLPLPNVNMGVQGYVERGIDRSLPDWAFHETVADAGLWPLGLDGARGIPDLPEVALLEQARALRDGKLDAESPFFKTFKNSSRLQLWMKQRSETRQALESRDLISKLMFLPDTQQTPLSQYGLQQSASADQVRSKFPNFASDPLEAQAALAFLLITQGVSASVTISPSWSVLLDGELTNPPLAFDYSHNAHRPAQAIMWDRLYKMADGLIDLLAGQEFDASTGESYWDRSLIYFATDFGRDKRRPSGSTDFGTGHHLNNGYVMLSPYLNGNSVLGGVDPDTGLTYGFDPQTGDPDTNRNMAEKEIYSGILHALGVDTSGSGLPDMRAMRKNA